ncbi:MAG TPA: stage III sporulation protein AA [Syntrophomonadaceae bacterium]|nr:stage III sporulation protein AA [Syntrophomonadaceae bacterium]
MNLLDSSIIEREIIPYLSPAIKSILHNAQANFYDGLEEIRLRVQKPLVLKIGDIDFTVNANGRITSNLEQGYIITEEDILRTIATISDNSLYAFEEEIKQGFITIPGGHRVGLAGQVIVDGYDIKTIKDFSGICLRVARERKGCASSLLKKVWNKKGQVNSTLIISPPRCGKTTILRDLARLLSTGSSEYSPQNVVIVDERSELAGSYRGVSQLDVGIRTDVLDSCPKALGMIMAIRSLSPQIIITDEIGHEKDVEAIYECANAGVAVITTIHARNIEELKARPLINNLIEMGLFNIGIVLSRRKGPGTVEEIVKWGANIVV